VVRMAENQSPEGRAPEVFGFDLLKASRDQKVTLEQGLVYLKQIAVAWDIPKTNFEYAARVPARFFNPNLSEIPVDKMEPRLKEWDKNLDFRGEFPEARFIFAATNLPNFKLLGMDLFDARTHRSISSGYSSGTTPDGFYLQPTVRLWHKAPIELFVHLAHSGPETYEIEPGDHEEKQIGPARVRLGGIISDLSSGISSSGDGRTNRVWLTFASKEQEKLTGVVLFVWPNAYRAPINYEVLDEAGNPLESYGGSTSGMIQVLNVRAKAELIKKIRLKLYPKISRLMFSVPYIPGLPPENSAVSNLFAVRIPYVRIREQYNFRAEIDSVLQLSLPFETMNFPPRFFPLTFTNITAQELLNEYLKYAPEQKQVYVNMPESRLEMRDPPLIEIWKRIKALFTR
jgi:hypothetical protein